MKGLTLQFGFAGRYLLAMLLKQDHGYTVKRISTGLLLTLSFLLLVMFSYEHALAESVYMPLVSNGSQSNNGTIPPADHNEGTLPVPDRSALIIEKQKTEGRAIDYLTTVKPKVTQSITDTTGVTNVQTINMEFGDMRVDRGAAYTWDYDTKTLHTKCVYIVVYLKIKDQFINILGQGCYTHVDPTLSVNNQYNDLYMAVSAIVELYNPDNK